MAAPPAIPTFAVELIHAPASSGGIACARTANWWVGLALLAVAAVFVTWGALRPVLVEDEDV